MTFNTTEPITERTTEDKIKLSKKRILNQFKNIKENINAFDSTLEMIVFSNQGGLTSTEVLSSFASSQKTELNRIKLALKELADDIVNQ